MEGERGRGGCCRILRQSSEASLWIRQWSRLILGFLGGGGGSGGWFGGGVRRGYGVPGQQRGGEGDGQLPSYSIWDLFKEGTEDRFQDGHGEEGEVVVEAKGME